MAVIRKVREWEWMGLHTGRVENVYSGKQGCMCGCLGRYWETGPMVKKVLNILKTHEHAKVQDGYILFIDYPNRDGKRNYVVYLKPEQALAIGDNETETV